MLFLRKSHILKLLYTCCKAKYDLVIDMLKDKKMTSEIKLTSIILLEEKQIATLPSLP